MCFNDITNVLTAIQYTIIYLPCTALAAASCRINLRGKSKNSWWQSDSEINLENVMNAIEWRGWCLCLRVVHRQYLPLVIECEHRSSRDVDLIYAPSTMHVWTVTTPQVLTIFSYSSAAQPLKNIQCETFTLELELCHFKVQNCWCVSSAAKKKKLYGN